MNATRWALFGALQGTGLPVGCGTGGRTKWNRTRLGIPKAHALDAACVGVVGSVAGWKRPTLVVKCSGRGTYQRTKTDAFGFPRLRCTRRKRVFGFATGDMVRATIPATHKNTGVHVGRVSVRESGSFDMATKSGKLGGVPHRFVGLLSRGDGYSYSLSAKPLEAAIPPHG